MFKTQFLAVCTFILHISDSTPAKKNFDFVINHPHANSFWKNYAKNAATYYEQILNESIALKPPVNQGISGINPWENNGWIWINGWNGIGPAPTTKKIKKPTTKPPKKPTTPYTEPTPKLTTDPSPTPTTDASSSLQTE